MDLRIMYIERDRYKILPQTPSLGVDYSPLMVESIVEVLVKEERRLEAILAAVPPLQSFSEEGLQPLCFSIFDLRLRPSRKQIPEGIYRRF
jgi:hypothetical protein